MKKLKFMLAAAAAIGLATASQADDYLGSTNFEGFNAGATVDSTLDALFEFTGVAADENESTIVEETYTLPQSLVRKYASGAHTKYMKVPADPEDRAAGNFATKSQRNDNEFGKLQFGNG